jgi:opacity protein-like surface antigen
MMKFAMRAAIAALAAGVALPAFAADMPEPIVEPAPAAPIAYDEPDVGGWYIRGDVDYHWSDLDGADYITYGPNGEGGVGTFDTTDLKGAMSLGAGVGYQIDDHFRVDLTGDYWFDADFRGSTSGVCGGAPCTSVDSSSVNTFLLLANAYVDLGTYHGITPYIGAGIGGARVEWDNLRNEIPGLPPVEHEGSANWRFAYAVMAGASYCLTNKLKLDAGYRYSRIEGGRMFEIAPGNPGPGFDGGFDTHEVRGGLRYQFGGRSGCEAPAEVAYEPPAVEPVYK